jgi:hypothetical protein
VNGRTTWKSVGKCFPNNSRGGTTPFAAEVLCGITGDTQLIIRSQTIETYEYGSGMRLSSDSTYALAKLGHGYAMAGRCDEARAVLNQLNALSSQRYISPYDIALVHVGL